MQSRRKIRQNGQPHWCSIVCCVLEVPSDQATARFQESRSQRSPCLPVLLVYAQPCYQTQSQEKYHFVLFQSSLLTENNSSSTRDTRESPSDHFKPNSFKNQIINHQSINHYSSILYLAHELEFLLT